MKQGLKQPAVQVKTLQIDGKDVSAREDQTILDVARENNVNIPTLCHLDGLCDVGACRLCVVEVKGQNKLLPACTTRVEEGMEVTTDTERLEGYRRTIVELLFSERNHICSICVSNGHCELQSMAMNLGVDHIRVPYRHPNLSVDASHDRFVIDHNRCILCTRCVRACDEIEGAHTKDVMGRGINAMIITDLMEPWGESASCTSCGKCVQACPTGALFEKGNATGEMAKKRQFIARLADVREARS